MFFYGTLFILIVLILPKGLAGLYENFLGFGKKIIGLIRSKSDPAQPS